VPRVLNERKFGERHPTAHRDRDLEPARDEYYNEPADPANLDRFAIQLRVSGPIQRATGPPALSPTARGRKRRRAARAGRGVRGWISTASTRSREGRRPSTEKDCWSNLAPFPVDYDCNETNCPHRPQLPVKSGRFARRALPRGEIEWTQRIRRCSLMTTFRVPEEVAAKVPELIEEIAA
jgi:hypothetical protein